MFKLNVSYRYTQGLLDSEGSGESERGMVGDAGKLLSQPRPTGSSIGSGSSWARQSNASHAPYQTAASLQCSLPSPRSSLPGVPREGAVQLSSNSDSEPQPAPRSAAQVGPGGGAAQAKHFEFSLCFICPRPTLFPRFTLYH